MKLRILSDLHLEFGPLDLQPIGEDVLVLAGDIGVYTDGAVWARDYARRHEVPVVMIAGNHEFYRNTKHQSHTVRSTLEALRAVADSEPLLTFLEDDIATVAGALFVGCTLWTDFSLNGDPSVAMTLAQASMNDYRLIQDDESRFTPRASRRINEFSVGLLRERLPRNYQDGKPLVVMTHHLPSKRSIAGRYANSEYSAAYASNLDDLVQTSGAALWVHGHTHISTRYRIGETEVICNPRGYVGYELNPDFNPDLLIEV